MAWEASGRAELTGWLQGSGRQWRLRGVPDTLIPKWAVRSQNLQAGQLCLKHPNLLAELEPREGAVLTIMWSLAHVMLSSDWKIHSEEVSFLFSRHFFPFPMFFFYSPTRPFFLLLFVLSFFFSAKISFSYFWKKELFALTSFTLKKIKLLLYLKINFK